MRAAQGIRRQFHLEMFKLEHESASDFYLSCWQNNRSALPLFFLRAFLCAASIAILVLSLVVNAQTDYLGYWLIFMTHWGVLLITFVSLCATIVSARAAFKGPIDSSFGLPWYVKVYWVSTSIGFTTAFFITIYYYSFLSGMVDGFDSELGAVLDVLVHGVNSIIMFLLLATSRHPTRLLHFYWPVFFGLVYLAFTGIYYAAGGLGIYGTHYIYPTLDWSKGGTTAVMVVVSAISIIVIHVVVVALVALRDCLARRFCGESDSMSIS